jgi:hypothetical protein
MLNLAGLHDAESVVIAPPGTWLLDTIALSENPQPIVYPATLNIITRINWGYGSSGTLPLSSVYEAFAQQVAAYVNASSGCARWIIGNETNLSREWPDGQPIYPWNYAACYKLCRQAIHALPSHAQDEVLVAGSGPWNAELKYNSNKNGDWIIYFSDVIDLCGKACDGYAIHAYTHGYDVSLVTSTARMNSPFQDRYYEFYTYRDYCEAIHPNLRHLPVYITEANGNGPWQAVGLMPAMLQEIDSWNHSKVPKIHCVTFYRYPHYDDFYIEGRGDVIAEYNSAVALGYESPVTPPTPTPPDPTPEPTPPEPPTPTPEPERDIDPRLLERGVVFTYVEPAPGTMYWRITKAEWLDHAAQQVGPDHHILGEVLKEGVQSAGVALIVSWPSGAATVYSKADDPNASYNYDYGMSKSLNEYSIVVAAPEGHPAPSDSAGGIGMGADGNSGIHTSTWITFAWTISSGSITPPTPATDVETGRVTAPLGLNVRSGPGTEFAILGTLTYGSTVLYLDAELGWLKLADGYVSAEYVGEPAGDEAQGLTPAPPLTPIPPATEQENWQRSLDFVLKWEGGWADDPNDPGGATMKGITLDTYTRWCKAHGQPQPTKADLHAITDAEVEEIYYQWYWLPAHCDKLAWPLCLSTFNLAVNAGVGQAEQTLLESNGDFLLFMSISIAWYTTISGWPNYGQAWTRRNADVLREATT